MSLYKLLVPYRILSTVQVVLHKQIISKLVKRELHVRPITIMAQRSITSFFKVTPPKPALNNKKELESKSVVKKEELSPVANGGEKKTSKRQRLDSSGSENEVKKTSKRQRLDSSSGSENEVKSPNTTSEKKKKPKRQRIESSGSENESTSDNQTTPNKQATPEKQPTPDKQATPEKQPKPDKQATPEKQPKPDKQATPEKQPKPDKQATPEKPIKTEKESPKTSPKTIKLEKSVKTYASPKTKKKKSEAKSVSPKKKDTKVKKEESPKRSPNESKVKEEPCNGDSSPEKNKENVQSNKTKEDSKDEPVEKILDSDYNPAKSKYHPINDACWTANQAVPYLALARTLEAIEGTSARLKIVEILANYLRSVIALTPEDLLPSVYMCLNKLAPAYHSLELGIAETYLMKAVGQCTGRTLAQVRAAAQKAGDLGAAAAAARATQRTMFASQPLTARKVFAALKEIAHMTGAQSVNKKISKIQSLFVACRQSEAKFLIRSLEGKLRIGLAEQSVLQAIAVAAATTPPNPAGVTVLDASKGLSTESFKSIVDEHALIVKTTYCECPNYDLLIPTLLQHGVKALPQHCRLTVGIPLKPMLAHPTKGVHEVFNRFEGCEFTCEYKYDGERAQIHVPGGGAGADLAAASVFSRNQENNTSKYPDILGRLSSLLKESVTSCVLDCEAVAYDTVNKQILPFQILSTRKRKGAVESEITVQVCVFVFDLLLLNDRPLVQAPLKERRALLREHFNTVEGVWQFAESRDCSNMEEVQQFLEESVKGSCEGLMVKTLTGEHAKYDIARRSHNWLKLKKDYLDGVGDTIDVVIIGAYRGRGKRHRTYGGFLAAARDPDSESYQALCKLGTGFSDDDLQKLTEELDKHVIEAPRSYYSYDGSHVPDVWFEAACVWEVRCADLSLSPAHRAAIGLVDPDKGISLRFPRFIRVREDKSAEQATSAQQIAEMYLSQDQVKNQTNKPKVNYDDFY